jgi:hypothetical protein
MKTLNNILAAVTLIASFIYGQNNTIENYFSKLPSEIENKNSEFQEYRVTLKWQNLDAINSSLFDCNAVQAVYKCGLDNGFVSWHDVYISSIENFQQPIGVGNKLNTFDGFTYQPLSDDFLKEGFYKKINAEQRDLAQWLVSDAMQMHEIGTMFFDSLTFNKEFYPSLMNNYNIQFENGVLFKSKYQKLIWTGISEYNDEICAIVKFESLYNPLEMDTPDMSLKGRSLYWGEFRISLEDKQVEYVAMVEDVIFKLKSAAFPQEQLVDLQREVTFNKIQ